MNASRKAASKLPRKISENKRVMRDYSLFDRVEAGVALQGWEVKAIRQGQAQIKESYVRFRQGEAFLVAAHIAPLKQCCSHLVVAPQRDRKLLLNKKELRKFQEKVTRAGYTVVALDLHWKGPWVKAGLALARGKKQHDQREAIAKKEWEREKARAFKEGFST